MNGHLKYSFYNIARLVTKILQIIIVYIFTIKCVSSQPLVNSNLIQIDLDGMFPSQSNKINVQNLLKNDGKIIFLNIVEFQFQNFSPYNHILKNCYKSINEPAFQGLLNGQYIALPVPLKSHVTDEMAFKFGNEYNNYNCEYFITFTLLDNNRLPNSSAGTGMNAIIVRKPFLVNYQKNGYINIFNLRETMMQGNGSAITNQNDACKRFPNLC